MFIRVFPVCPSHSWKPEILLFHSFWEQVITQQIFTPLNSIIMLEVFPALLHHVLTPFPPVLHHDQFPRPLIIFIDFIWFISNQSTFFLKRRILNQAKSRPCKCWLLIIPCALQAVLVLTHPAVMTQVFLQQFTDLSSVHRKPRSFPAELLPSSSCY